MYNTKTLPIYSMRLAGFLMLRGFVCLDIAKNNKDCTRNIYWFGESENIRKAMNDFKLNKDIYIQKIA